MEDSQKEIEVPSTLQKTIIWKAITGISFAVIIILIVSSITIIGKALNLLQPVLVPVAIACRFPGDIDIGIFELISDSNKTLEVLKFTSITFPTR